MKKDYFELIQETREDVKERKADDVQEEKSDMVQEIYDIADSTYIGHLMDTAENEVPVFSMEKDLTPHKEADVEILLIETEETADVVEHMNMGELIGMMGRNWKALKELTNTEIRNAMINIYSDKDPVVVEAAVDTALYLVRAEMKAA